MGLRPIPREHWPGATPTPAPKTAPPKRKRLAPLAGTRAPQTARRKEARASRSPDPLASLAGRAGPTQNPSHAGNNPMLSRAMMLYLLLSLVEVALMLATALWV